MLAPKQKPPIQYYLGFIQGAPHYNKNGRMVAVGIDAYDKAVARNVNSRIAVKDGDDVILIRVWQLVIISMPEYDW